MELIMGLFALFMFCFGSRVVLTALDFGTSVGDRTLSAFGHSLKWCLKTIGKGLVLLARHALKRVRKTESDLVIRPLIVTPLELQHMRYKQLFQSGKRMPVVIEYPQNKIGD